MAITAFNFIDSFYELIYDLHFIYPISITPFATHFLCFWTHLIVVFSSNSYPLNVGFTHWSILSSLFIDHSSDDFIYSKGFNYYHLLRSPTFIPPAYSSLDHKIKCPIEHPCLDSHRHFKFIMLQTEVHIICL